MGNTFNWHREAEKQWDGRAGFWSSRSEYMWAEGSRKSIIPFLKEYLPAGSEVADLGCGDGFGSQLLHQEGYRVCGVDLSKDMIEIAKERMEPAKLEFIQGDITALPFEADRFDGIMAINCLEWIEVPVKGLEEMKRILKPGGKLCVGILGPTAKPRMNSYPRLYGEEVICNTMMPWELKQLAKETGWNHEGGHGVFKEGVNEKQIQSLPEELKKAVSFMWVYVFTKK
ncbi:class I SAM-dependent methyltransferase [Halobacillus salinarum]|uniref:Class I SAM-dependent methyltransferase n=1 Tax=Halobacillus salinarum TaxID=2932257 RepID=A0ABY4EQP5_9BACI|nr:class I SAM-dependent methyltransferase [Halobacillus salinarum]UOQ44426.1 class I SAM-dependent methyltransferase [Halobacillus salinarum]